jgi:hypothetical protein
MTARCCTSTADFPNTCAIGACGACTCFNGSACVSQ